VTGAPSIVLIHGVGLDHTMWNRVLPGLGHRRFVTYDLLGHGSSAPLPSGSDLSALVDQLRSVCDAEPFPIDIVGFSLGALIAQCLALSSPERVRRLILVSGVFNRSADERSTILERVADVREGGYLNNVAAAIDRWFAPEFAAAHPDVLAAVTERMMSNDVASYANAYEIFATADEALAAQVHRITCPTLVVTGEHDPRSTPAMSHALAATVANGHAVVLPGARHLTPLEVPDALARLITTFVEEPDA
jgi:(E)-2-((N-methylformamido)methylene)succinate hydrolase